MKKHADSSAKVINYYKSKNEYLEITFHTSGDKYKEGWYIDGLREGEWFSWYSNGVLWSYGRYSKGMRQGHSEAFHSNGVKQLDQYYKNNEPDSLWQFFANDGRLTMKLLYRDGKLISKEEF